MNTQLNLSDQEICILISSMQCMTKHEEKHAGPSQVVSDLYNKLTIRHEHLLRINKNYEHDL
jgi:hypothetical protein